MASNSRSARRWFRSSPETRETPATTATVLSMADYTLAEMANGAKTTLNATGVAIALESEGAIVCRARAGEAAPEIGTEVRRGQGITGECVVTGAVMRCADTQNDLRVNAAVCRSLGIRSLVVAPLRRQLKIVGVVEAVYSAANGFDESAVETLQAVARQIVARVYGDEAAATEEEQTPVAPATDVQTPVAPATEAPSGEQNPAGIALTAFSPAPKERARRPRTALVAVLILAVAVGGALVSAYVGQLRARTAAHRSDEDAWVRIQQAAEAGDPAAQYDLALAYKSGSGMPRDTAAAAKWLRAAAERGNPEAQYDLAKALENGNGVPRDDEQAYTWFVIAGLTGKSDDADVQRVAPRLSAEQMAQARFDVGEMLAAGEALHQDLVAAYVWFALAGDGDAKVSRERVASQLTPEQLAEAKARVRRQR